MIHASPPTVLHSLNQGLHAAFAADPRVVLIGEDILDPYGGAFKVSRGLSTAYPDRVLTSPISEAGIAGAAGGMALRGLRPVVEIMFGDFLTLTADQLINHITKFPYMYNQQVRVPVVVRTPMGGRRGYGATHSQTLEKHFLGVPGLRILAPCAFAAPPVGIPPGELLQAAILQDDLPVLFIENKLLYTTTLKTESDLPGCELTAFNEASEYAPTFRLAFKGAPAPQVTLATYGYMAELAVAAMQKLALEAEIFAELLIFTQLLPFQTQALAESLRQTRRLVTIEEGGLTAGWGAELLARAVETDPLPRRPLAARRVAALDQPIPAAVPLETAVLPDTSNILAAALSLF